MCTTLRHTTIGKGSAVFVCERVCVCDLNFAVFFVCLFERRPLSSALGPHCQHSNSFTFKFIAACVILASFTHFYCQNVAKVGEKRYALNSIAWRRATSTAA